jgi:hypothetical protein
MAPYIKRRSANALMQMDAKSNATRPGPLPSDGAGQLADPPSVAHSPEPTFTPLEEILDERRTPVPPPPSATRAEPQVNLPTMSDVRDRMQQDNESWGQPVGGNLVRISALGAPAAGVSRGPRGPAPAIGPDAHFRYGGVGQSLERPSMADVPGAIVSFADTLADRDGMRVGAIGQTFIRNGYRPIEQPQAFDGFTITGYRFNDPEQTTFMRFPRPLDLSPGYFNLISKSRKDGVRVFSTDGINWSTKPPLHPRTTGISRRSQNFFQ